MNGAESLLYTLRAIDVGVLGCEAVAGVLVVPVEKTRQADVRFLNVVLMKVIAVDCAEKEFAAK